MRERQRRVAAIIALTLAGIGGLMFAGLHATPPADNASTAVLSAQTSSQQKAGTLLDSLAVKGRAPKTGYSRKQFGDGWADTGACDMRNRILARDMQDVRFRSPQDCTVMTGTLHDPYTGKTIGFSRSKSSAVQIDHVVALSDAWQKGAQQLSPQRRAELANDPLELLAVDGPANNQKGDGDAATWLPPNKAYRCRYVARQIAVKAKYGLWVTGAERAAMRDVLSSCPDQTVPLVLSANQTASDNP